MTPEQEEELKEHGCNGPRCNHETSADHYLVDKSFILKVADRSRQEGVREGKNEVWSRIAAALHGETQQNGKVTNKENNEK